MIARRGALLLAAVSLAGCTLIDQTTFNPQAGEPPPKPVPPPAPAPPPPGPPPLLVVGPAGPAGQEAAIRGAATAALSRRPGVLFDVVEIQPPNAPADAAIGANARRVAELIAASGAPAGAVRLAVRPETGGCCGAGARLRPLTDVLCVGRLRGERTGRGAIPHPRLQRLWPRGHDRGREPLVPGVAGGMTVAAVAVP